MTKAIKNQIDKFEYREKNIIRILLSVFVLLSISYGLLVNSTIMNSIKTEQLSSNISALGSSINSMEFDYLNAKNAITMDLAISKGFVAVTDQKFLALTPSSDGLSLSTNENR
jgi:outer membrane murein-binding lipoprotein Lpp